MKDLKIERPNYKIGDLVKLKKGMFMRGEDAIAELSDDKLELRESIRIVYMFLCDIDKE